ncbi:MAG: DUF2141 domain-containing protein [Opitutales bacterium]|jgi:uncharacterized protein (DUF2141 family)
MKMNKIWIACAMLLAGCITALAAGTATLKIVVEGISGTEGKVRVALYDSEGNWLKNSVRGDAANPTKPETVLVFEDLEPGEYAISVMYDIDGDGKLNKNMFGMPTEPYGFSNNARGSFGPAKWSNAKFSVIAGDNEARLTVR